MNKIVYILVLSDLYFVIQFIYNVLRPRTIDFTVINCIYILMYF
jgi:hypothetical protein